MTTKETFTFKTLTDRDLEDIMKLQEECVATLPDPSLFYPLSRDELEESLRLDIVIGAFTGSVPVAVAIIVANRKSPRNLGSVLGYKSEQAYTFDAVMVLPRWRGHGLQSSLLRQCMEIAQEARVARIVATVSPDNKYSLANFKKLGFEIVTTSEKYGGLIRHIVSYNCY